jgi:NADPH-dependent 2,4-dienoyl-CoA reductase/sulfur reductase-like enzyme
MPDPFVIVGAGLAGAKAAETLREEGFDGPVVLVGEESEPPYERPPLSKDYLLGKAERDASQVHPPDWYAEHDVDLRTGVRATELDPAGHRVELATGESLTYDKLLLATGSSARRLPVPGADLEGVRYLRTRAEADRLKEELAGGGRRVVVVGAGWIGLEVTAAARTYGNDVTVVEPQPTPLHAVLGPEMGSVFARLHRDHGVDLFTDTTVRELRGSSGRVEAVVTDHHAGLPADLVVVGIGAAPNTQLAAAAGLEVDNGVVVDERLRSATPDVYAAGDVGRGPVDARPGRVLRAGAVLLHRPVRPGHGVLRARRPGRLRHLPGRPRERRVHRLLGHRGGPGHRRHERERLGRHRPDPGAHPVPPRGADGPPGRPRHVAGDAGVLISEPSGPVSPGEGRLGRS